MHREPRTGICAVQNRHNSLGNGLSGLLEETCDICLRGFTTLRPQRPSSWAHKLHVEFRLQGWPFFNATEPLRESFMSAKDVASYPIFIPESFSSCPCPGLLGRAYRMGLCLRVLDNRGVQLSLQRHLSKDPGPQEGPSSCGVMPNPVSSLEVT